MTSEAPTPTAGVAFFWSATTPLPQGWRSMLDKSIVHPQLTVSLKQRDEIWIYDSSHSMQDATASFIFQRERGAGSIQSKAGDLSVLAALKIAHCLGLAVSDASGIALASDKPLEWLEQIEFAGAPGVVEDMAAQLGLVERRFSLSDLAGAEPHGDGQMFF